MKTDLTQGPIPKLLIKLALPALGSMFSDILFHLINTFWIGQLGSKALAAQTTSAFIIWMMFNFTSLVGIGTTAIIARRIGEKRNEDAEKVASQSIVIGLYISLIFGAILLIIMNPVMDFIGAESAVTLQAKEFLTIYIIGIPSIFLFTSIDSIFKGYGNTKMPMWILTLALAINACIDPVFIFVFGLGFKGAACATIIARLSGSVLGLILLKKLIFDKYDKQVSNKNLAVNNLFHPNLALTFQLVKIGLPPMLSGVLFSLVYMVLAKIINIFGSEALAAIGVGHRIESISFCTFMALSIATTSIVGQNLGARKIERAEKAVHTAYIAGAIISLLIAILFLGFPEKIISIMTSDPKVIDMGALYLRITTSSLIFMALEIITQGGFNGSGNTLPPMCFNIVFTLMRIPLAYFLAINLKMSIAGVWWAINISSILKGASVALWFRLGHWKKKHI